MHHCSPTKLIVVDVLNARTISDVTYNGDDCDVYVFKRTLNTSEKTLLPFTSLHPEGPSCNLGLPSLDWEVLPARHSKVIR